MRKENSQKGFTLIEVIAVLLIVGILAAFAGLGIVSAVQGYLFAKDTAAVSEKAQLALARINRELLECYDCSPIVVTLPSPFTSVDFNNTIGPRTLSWTGSGGNIEINTDILLDKVASFSMIYNADNSITITIQSLTQPGGVTVPAFSTIVYPRNTI